MKKNTQPILLRIWDTAGQERFQSISYSYIRKADGIFVVFDLSNRRTYDKTEFFLNKIQENCRENVAVVLVGNKNDIEREVLEEEAQNMADSKSIKYYEKSAEKGTNIDEAFMYLTELSFKQMEKQNEESVIKLDNQEKSQDDDKSGCNC